MADHEKFMRMAIDEARKAGEAGNRAVGCVIVRGDDVLGAGGNQVRSAKDPLAHGETVAFRDAVAKTGSVDFAGCTLYSTLEPCPMCCGAIAVNNIELVVVGVMHAFVEPRWGNYTVRELTALIGRGTEIIDGVLQDDCKAVLLEFAL
jgi:tRNA(adenine34) deaminase